MDVYKKTRVKKPCKSILKNGGRYSFSSSGKHLGTIVVDRDTAFRYSESSDIAEVAAAFGKTESEIYLEVERNIAYGTTTDAKYHVGVYEVQNVNEMGYGVFELKYSHQYGNFFRDYKSDMNSPKLVPTHNLKDKVLSFFKESDGDRKKKVGMLLYGPPGNGKTSDIISIFDIAAQEKIRIFLVDTRVDLSDLNEFKSMLEQDGTIFILEELTQRERTEELLTFLDGENSWKNSVVIATTNHPEQLPENLVDRPGRFEQFFEYANPTRDQINQLAKSFGFENLDPQTHAVPNFIFAGQELFGQDLSFDYVSFILSSAKKSGLSIKETRQMEADKRKRLSSTFKGKMGLGN